MNAGKQPILVMNQGCSCTVTQLTNQLNASGFSVVKTFDLLSALSRYPNCICQMVILLVYGQDGPPATLIFDGNDISTSVFLENDSERTSRSRFIALLSKLPDYDQPSEDRLNEAIDKRNSSPTPLHDK